MKGRFASSVRLYSDVVKNSHNIHNKSVQQCIPVRNVPICKTRKSLQQKTLLTERKSELSDNFDCQDRTVRQTALTENSTNSTVALLPSHTTDNIGHLQSNRFAVLGDCSDVCNSND